ncbi:30S ribosomal protein S3 [Mesomycoplasma ovipneumoniae]|uniref:Small ribosomal subunit protein uS3 n=1 Tax=Mesomycoplasma ovipneumoniae TaxID=29562 RepID=A0AAP5Y328_9BACT|nr:30S ribosomal protein S3 [Mesomycoplasma ovipneumoniae]MCN0157712.1 30S ribosomal protein S3 [Mesomycoplasma ovipneumoniae]MDO6829885.1 30S ribosomal protein S3 [Mesomycoplasma ovipneumoniae]MDO6856997.1 30S ribosomal protein S3 [Mesomycoplasma ovipneumoniae]MDW2907582.1 30S ribosomal protein S3 [Mesomycoplasma ovipneumoniae]MDW2908865.1 30S ribosomal protein S3 [Mesomycoplasma ovipneumoniae]
MGQKVNPNGFRFGITRAHNAIWYADKNKFATNLLEDVKIHRFFEKLTREYQIGNTIIRRDRNNAITVLVYTARLGSFLGSSGENLKKIVEQLKKTLKNRKIVLHIDAIEITNPELNAKLMAETIAQKLEQRGSYRIAQKFAIRTALKAGAKGVKTLVSGRLNGVEMARSEGYAEGEMKLHTLRQNVEYATAIAKTTYGILGVKVWVSLGETRQKIDIESVIRSDKRR